MPICFLQSWKSSLEPVARIGGDVYTMKVPFVDLKSQYETIAFEVDSGLAALALALRFYG